MHVRMQVGPAVDGRVPSTRAETAPASRSSAFGRLAALGDRLLCEAEVQESVPRAAPPSPVRRVAWEEQLLAARLGSTSRWCVP
jgi:hypothetical protein